MSELPGRLTGKAGIVTGSTSGIGAAIARRLHREGASVVVTGRDNARGHSIMGELGDRAIFLRADLSDDDAGDQLRDACLEAFGVLDILVNNAGIDHTGALQFVSKTDVLHTFEVNTFAAIRLMQSAAEAMRGRGGSIINITSRLAHVGVPTMSVYGASKGAIATLTRGAAVEWGPAGIRVNEVAPGMTRTPLYDEWLAQADDRTARENDAVAGIPLGRVALPEDIAGVVCFLASDEAAYITGATIPVDGGYTAR